MTYQQDRPVYRYKSLSSTAAISSAFMIGVIAAAEKGKVVILDISGAYLRAKMPKIVQWRMRG